MKLAGSDSSRIDVRMTTQREKKWIILYNVSESDFFQAKQVGNTIPPSL